MKHILIHGLGQKASSWNETTSYMTGQYTIICPELSLFIKDNVMFLPSTLSTKHLTKLFILGATMSPILVCKPSFIKINLAPNPPTYFSIILLYLITPKFKIKRLNHYDGEKGKTVSNNVYDAHVSNRHTTHTLTVV